MCTCSIIYATYLSSVTTVVADITLTLFYHTYAAELSTRIIMWLMGRDLQGGQVEVCYVYYHIQVIYCEVDIGVIVGDKADSIMCVDDQSLDVTLPGWDAAYYDHALKGGVCCPICRCDSWGISL